MKKCLLVLAVQIWWSRTTYLLVVMSLSSLLNAGCLKFKLLTHIFHRLIIDIANHKFCKVTECKILLSLTLLDYRNSPIA
ncbi:hypothetical protein PR048_012945 [Dryococelus australis]|uniref:Secreted protein n=1 Tax=Dryococelus australis TaxID=614101 RepID=A0ABQ9HS93_9NEOP|nr:hypothetical protein PR048_012945 [Dryococelus australis]